MTTLREVAELEVQLRNEVSEGAQAAARDLEKVEAAATKAQNALKAADGTISLVGNSFDTLTAKVDANARAEMSRQAITARAERQMAELTAAAAREGRSQDELARSLAAVAAARDADIAKAEQAAAKARAQQMALTGGITAQTQAMAASASATNSAASSTGRFTAAIGQAGFQVQDLAVQLAGGQNALVAFSQQGSQLLGAFGKWGAIAGAALAIGGLVLQLALGKSESERLTDAIEGQRTAYQDVTRRADEYVSALTRQGLQYVSAAEAGRRYREGLREEAQSVVNLSRYYGGLSEAQRLVESRRLQEQQLSLNARQDALMGRVGTTLGAQVTAFGGQASQDLERGIVAFQDAGRLDVDEVSRLANQAIALSRSTRTSTEEFTSNERAILAVVEAVRQLRDAQRQLEVQQQTFNGENGAQLTLRRFEQVTQEVGGRYQTRQRIQQQRQYIQDGIALGTLTPEQVSAGRSSLQVLGQQEQGLTPATQQQLRALREQASLALAAEGASRELAQAELELDRAARSSGAGMASAGEKAEARRLVQERLNRQLVSSLVTLNRQIDGEERIAAAYGRSDVEGRQAESRIRAEAEALRYAEEGTREYERAVDTLTVRYTKLAEVQAQRQQATRNIQSRDELEVLEREAQLVSVTAEARERELAVLRARQSTRGIAGTPEAEEAVRLAGSLADARSNLQLLQNSWGEVSRLGEQAFDRIGSAITQAFANGSLKAIDFGNVARAVLNEIVQSALRLSVVNPVLNSLFGGSRGTLSGVSTVVGGTKALSDGSSSGSLLSTGSSALSIGNRLFGSGGNALGGFSFLTDPSAMASTGWGGLDGLLNTQLVGNSTNAALGGLGSGVYGPATQAQLTAAGGPGLTLGGALGSGLAIGGGIYGAISGFQRGGLGGTLSGIGGVTSAVTGAAGLGASLGLLPALGALGPIGIIGGALLALIGGLLPGQKPSGKGQEFRLDLATGAEERNGLTGNRYSAENASQAEAAARNLANLATTIGDQLGGLRLGGELAVGVTSGRGGSDKGNLYLDYSGQKARFANDEAGAQQLATTAAGYLLEGFKKIAQGDYLSILNASGNSVETLSSNLEWYKGTYQALTKTGEAASDFEKSLTALRDQWQPAIDKANELGLATAALTDARDLEIAKLREQRALQIAGYDVGLDVRSLRARGLTQEADLAAFDIAARQELFTARSTLEGLGLSAEDISSRILRTEQVQAEERLAIQQKYGEQAAQLAEQTAQAQKSSAQSVLTWLINQQLGSTSSLSPTARLAAAQGAFDTALAGGDASKVTSAADALLTAGQNVYGGATGSYARLEGFVRSEVAGFGSYAANQSGDVALQKALQAIAQQNAETMAALTQAVGDLVREIRVTTIQKAFSA